MTFNTFLHNKECKFSRSKTHKQKHAIFQLALSKVKILSFRNFRICLKLHIREKKVVNQNNKLILLQSCNAASNKRFRVRLTLIASDCIFSRIQCLRTTCLESNRYFFLLKRNENTCN